MQPRDIIALVTLITIGMIAATLGLWFYDHSAAKHAAAYSGLLVVVSAALRGWYHGEY